MATNFPKNSGYSQTDRGEIMPDGTHVDTEGNEIPAGLDEGTKAQLMELCEPRKPRVIPSYADLLRAAGAVEEPKASTPVTDKSAK